VIFGQQSRGWRQALDVLDQATAQPRQQRQVRALGASTSSGFIQAAAPNWTSRMAIRTRPSSGWRRRRGWRMGEAQASCRRH